MISNPGNDNISTAPSGQRWLWLPAMVIMLALVVLISIPYGMSWALQGWLLDNGAGQVEINDINFNPFTGIASVESLNIRVSDHNTLVIPHLLLEVDWSPFLEHRIYIKTVTVDGLNVQVVQDADREITVGGIRIKDSSPEETQGKPWGYGVIKLNIRNSVIDYRTPELQLKTEIHNLSLTELATWLARPAPLLATGKLNGSDFEINGKLPSLEKGYGYHGHIKLAGLPLKDFAALARPAATALTGRAVLDTTVDLELMPERPFSLRQTGALQVDDLYLGLPAQQVELSQGSVRWDGTITYNEGETPKLTANGKLHLENTDVDAVKNKLQLIGFMGLDAENIKLQGTDSITIGTVSISDAVFAETLGESGKPVASADKPPPLKIASLKFDNIAVIDGKRLSIDTILSDHATYVAQRGKDGQWRMATILGSLFPDTEAAPNNNSGGEPGSIRIGVLKNSNATLTLEDNSVSPAFQMQSKVLQSMKNIDSAKPDQDSPVYLKGHIAKYNSVEIKGTVRPFADPVSLNLQSHIEGLEMPPFSPYVIASIGHRIDSGQLDADSTLVLDKGQLDGMNTLTLRSLELTPVKGKQQGKIESELHVPLNKGLDMLRDNNNVIHLKLPITGDLDNPDFNASDAVNQAIAKATREGAITSLTLLLQPYGSLITVARYAAEKAAEIKLDPVIFSPASAEIKAARHDYLNKVAGIIKKRPNINVRLCGVATAADRAAMQEGGLTAGEDKKTGKAEQQATAIGDDQLIDLADRRDDAIKDYFIEKHGVKAGRLVACKPSIDAAEGAQPRVDLLI